MPNYPVPYQNNWGIGGIGQMYPQYPQSISGLQQPTPQQTQTNGMGLKWVDGEVGAKAYQMPAGWPANQPIALWDTNDTVIYLKSINPMGMPNPLQKARYVLEEYKSATPGKNETSGHMEHDMSDYVKKEDLERIKQDLMDTIGSMHTSGTGARRTAKEE